MPREVAETNHVRVVFPTGFPEHAHRLQDEDAALVSPTTFRRSTTSGFGPTKTLYVGEAVKEAEQ
jgi:hypothetical protein